MSKQILSSNRSSLSGDNLLKLDPTPEDASLLEENQISGEEMHVFPTGHQIRIDLEGQSIEVSDIHGKLQAQINITADGPQISINGGDLKLQSPENIAMDCNSFRLHTEEDTEIIAKGHVMIDARKETRISCDEDVYVRGQVIWLN